MIKKNSNNELINHYLDKNLSLGKIDNACEYILKLKTVPEDELYFKV